MQAQGYKETLRWAREYEFGVTPTSPAMVELPFNSHSIRAGQNRSDPATITGTRQNTKALAGYIDVGGDATLPLDVRAIGYWLFMMFGNPTTTGSNPYTHVFIPQDILPSATMEAGFSDNPTTFDHFSQFSGCRVQSLSFNFGGDGELTFSVNVLGISETVGTSSADATPETIALARFHNTDVALQEGGSDIGTVTECSIALENNLDSSVYALGSKTRRDLPAGLAKVSGSIKAVFGSQALFDKAANGTESSLTMTLTSGSYSLTIDVQELIYERATIERNGAAGMFVSLPFTAFFEDGVDGSVVTATLVNDMDYNTLTRTLIYPGLTYPGDTAPGEMVINL